MSESEGNFNDSELQDIMSEIENLEKEFHEEVSSEEESSAPVEQVEASSDSSDSKEEIVDSAAVEALEEEEPDNNEDLNSSSDKIIDEVVEQYSREKSLVEEAQDIETQMASELVPSSKPNSEKSSNFHSKENDTSSYNESNDLERHRAINSQDHPMEFYGEGKMNLSVTFQIGNEKAKVDVDHSGLKVTIQGVELNITDQGCEVEMQGGVKFSVPLTDQTHKEKKAA